MSACSAVSPIPESSRRTSRLSPATRASCSLACKVTSICHDTQSADAPSVPPRTPIKHCRIYWRNSNRAPAGGSASVALPLGPRALVRSGRLRDATHFHHGQDLRLALDSVLEPPTLHVD